MEQCLEILIVPKNNQNMSLEEEQKVDGGNCEEGRTSKTNGDSRVDELHSEQGLAQGLMSVLDLTFALAVWQLKVFVCLLSIAIALDEVGILLAGAREQDAVSFLNYLSTLPLLPPEARMTHLRGPTELAQTTTASESSYYNDENDIR